MAELHGQRGETLDVGKPLISVTPVSTGIAANDAARPLRRAPIWTGCPPAGARMSAVIAVESWLSAI
ncbi:hypothetical protein [Pseudarthrobacter sp. W1I19]|uniref:hypothetical protein n=1 Tax=Pseudarthrobacter sp. W1I19 TaxID=3042288 RepID=UPI003593D87F